MEECSNMNGASHRNWIIKVNPFQIQQGKDRQWKHLTTKSNDVMTFMRKWFADYFATTAAMNDLFSTLAKESTMQNIKVNPLSSSATIIGMLKPMFRQIGLMMCRCAVSRLRCHDHLTRSGKSQEVPNDTHFLIKI